jgi:hypothetical protein
VWCERCVRARRETRQLHPRAKRIAGQTNQDGFQQYSEDDALGIGTRESQRVLQRAAKDSKSPSNSRGTAQAQTERDPCEIVQNLHRGAVWLEPVSGRHFDTSRPSVPTDTGGTAFAHVLEAIPGAGDARDGRNTSRFRV